MKHWLQSIDSKATTVDDESTREHRNLLIIMKAILSTEEPFTPATQPAKASEKEFPTVEEEKKDCEEVPAEAKEKSVEPAADVPMKA